MALAEQLGVTLLSLPSYSTNRSLIVEFYYREIVRLEFNVDRQLPDHCVYCEPNVYIDVPIRAFKLCVIKARFFPTG